MRTLLFILIATILCSCNNDLTSIGQDLTNNGNYVEMEEYRIDNMWTVKLDSFVTSSGYATESYALQQLFMGKYEDDYSGTTTAIPCFQVVPTYQPAINENVVLDSVTLNFRYAGKLWGDTIRPQLQKFSLYRLDKLPELNKDDDFLFYNTYPLPPYTEKLGEVQFYPIGENMKYTYIKLNTEAGKRWSKDIFEAMIYNSKDNIFNDLPWSFINTFKGMTIIPDAGNNCIMNIKASIDSLYLRFHYHRTEDESYQDIYLGQKELMFNSIKTENAPRFSALTNQEKSVAFSEAKVALIQGQSGYMTRMTLPTLPLVQQYTTIIKAELELTPEIFATPAIAMPQTINVYTTDNNNEILQPLYNSVTAGTVVTGQLVPDPLNNSNSKYIFDLTDYYQRVSTGTDNSDLYNNRIMLTCPGLTSTFNRAIIVERPVVRVYYAKYK